MPALNLGATPQGKPIYEKLGSVSEYETERWKLQPPATPGVLEQPSEPPDLDRILALDCQVSG